MANNLPELLRLEDHEITFCNFTGREVKIGGNTINREGNHNFCVVLDDEEADRLIDEGWHVRVKEFDDGSRRNTLQVAVRFDIERFKPRVVMVTPKGDRFKKNVLSEDLISELDSARVVSADLMINPSAWRNAMGNSGIKAYLKTGYFVVEADEFEDKYPGDEDEEDELLDDENVPF